MDEDRTVVFISHANPEDNEFTLWLASRLTSLGFLVWSDLTKLFGAEIIWQDIEDAIRRYAAKVVVVLSRTAQRKDGVLDEINLAVSVERKYGLERFVVPVRLDNLPFSDVKPNLARKNIIDFTNNWATGFGQLLKVLDRDKVPREQTCSAKEISDWLRNILGGSQLVVRSPQSLLSNWFEFRILPQELNFLLVPVPKDQLSKRFELFSYPVYPYQGMLATFANEKDANEFLPAWQRATTGYRIPLSALLEGEPRSFRKFNWADFSNMVSFLIRTAWDATMRGKGLYPYEMANGRKAWFPLAGYTDDGWIRYMGADGAERRKRLVGRSEKRKVYWHFAAEMLPLVGRELRIVLKPHVVFTRDGLATLASDHAMHRLRRGFCRNWWNPRWRDLLLAYTTMITDESGSITVAVGSEQALVVDPRPTLFSMPVSPRGLLEPITADDETDSQLDAWAADFDWEGYDEEEDRAEDPDQAGEGEEE